MVVVTLRLIDTHSHLNHQDFASDVEETLRRAADAGVDRIIVPGYDLPSSRRAVELAQEHERIYATVGVHPHDAKTFDPDALAEIRAMVVVEKVVAIGEIGLDFHYDFSPRDRQMEAFILQAQLAGEFEIPLVVHTREAAPEVVDVLTSVGVGPAGGVMHHFSGDEAFARQAFDLGLLIGIAGPLTYKKNEELRETVRRVGVERLVVETDAPYASPVPFRGKRNEPAYVAIVAEKVAEITGVALDEVAARTTENAERVFGLGVRR
jgi:TatD DNase family protein